MTSVVETTNEGVVVTETETVTIIETPQGVQGETGPQGPQGEPGMPAVYSDALPQPLGESSAGILSEASRADHVHFMPTPAEVGAETPTGAQGRVDALGLPAPLGDTYIRRNAANSAYEAASASTVRTDLNAETPEGAQTKVDTHAGATNPHDATALPTAERLVLRDALGRAKVAAPVESDDIARKDTVDNLGLPAPAADTYPRRNSLNTAYESKTSAEVRADLNAETPEGAQGKVDTHAAVTGTAHGAASTAQANALMARDAAGRAKVAVPAEPDDIARKDNVDAVQTNLSAHESLTSPHNATPLATADRLMLRDGAGRAKVAAPFAIDDIAIKDTVDTVQVNLDTHSGNTANPHGVTKDQVGLASVVDALQWHAGNDGAGSGLDADLLDGNEAAAFLLNTEVAKTADTFLRRNSVNGAYEAKTITDILNELTTVDGSGSGLDADMVDGIDAGGMLKTYAMYDASGHTLPSQTPIQWYTGQWLNNNIGAPEGMTYGRILGYTDLSNAAGYSFQIARGHSGAFIYLRVANNNAWSNWQRIVTFDPAENPWIAPTLTNGWVNFGGTFAPAGYYKDKQGQVHLRGLIKSGTIPSVAFTLPAGYQPPLDGIFAVASANLYGQLEVHSNGNVYIRSPSSNTWVSLAGISFRAA